MDKYIHIPGVYNNQIACQPLNAYGHEKIAEEKSTKLDPKVIDLVKKITPNPDKHIFILLTALGAGEIWGGNSNADFFFEKDLNSEDPSFGYKTFTDAGIYTHHKNKDISKSLGQVLLSIYNPKMRRVELVERVDRDKAKEHGASDIYDRLNDGEHLDVSMGCRVKYDVCMVCGNKAPTRNEYCDEMRRTPGKILPDGRIVCVYNPKPVFFDISFVNVGAAKNAKVMDKLAQKEDGRICLGDICTLPLIKTASSVVSDVEIGAKHKSSGETYEDQLLNDLIRDFIIQKKLEKKLQSEPSLEGVRSHMRNAPSYDSNHIEKFIGLDKIGNVLEPNTLKNKSDRRKIHLDPKETDLYKKASKRQTTFKGLTINIEVDKGEIRKKKTFSTKMKCAYGHIPKTSGEDGEEIDVYLNNDPISSRVFIVRQLKEDKTYDEDKIMLGFNSKEEAKNMYLEHIPPKFFGAIIETDMNTFLDKYLPELKKTANSNNCDCGCNTNCVASNSDEVISQLFNKLSSLKNASQNKQGDIIKKVPALIEPISKSTDKVDFLKQQRETSNPSKIQYRK